MDLIILGAIVLGLTELVKITVGVSSRFIPATALILTAILFGVFVLVNKAPVDWTLIQNVLVVALSSVGLYSSAKNSLQ